MSYIGTTEYYFQVARGLVPRTQIRHKWGRNGAVGTAYESMWNGGGFYTGFNATAAETVEVFSASANDTTGGTGARTVEVYGLDADYLYQTETVTLNGTTPVDTVNQYIRLDTAACKTAGSLGFNDGEITGRQKTTTANVFFVMPANTNRTAIACYTVPANFNGFVASWFGSISKKQNATANLRLATRRFGELFETTEDRDLGTSGGGGFDVEYTLPKKLLTPKTDIQISTVSDVAALIVSGGFGLILYEE